MKRWWTHRLHQNLAFYVIIRHFTSKLGILRENIELIGKLKKLQPGFRTKMSLFKQQRKTEAGNYAETMAMANIFLLL